MNYDFETPYKKFYPRKGEGKSAGMKKLTKDIKTDQDYSDFCIAVENISEFYKIHRTERKFMKMWSTFCNNWRDYVSREDLGLTPKASGEMWFT